MPPIPNWIDQPGSVRDEDQLDLPALVSYLRTILPDLEGEAKLKQFRGGASNLTYELRVGEKAFIVRCAPSGTKSKGAHDMGREFRIMQQLKPVFPYVPAMIAWQEDPTTIGKEFYVMERLEGLIPRKNMPESLNLSPDQVHDLCTHALDVLVELHQLDVSSAGLDGFGKGGGYATRQVEGWWSRYQQARTWNTPGFKQVAAWLQENIPTTERTCFIHNDFRFDNLVFSPENPTEIIGVLDWEMATVGDPLMDLGSALAYWVEAEDDFFMKKVRRQPTHLPGMLNRKEVIDYYCKKMGFSAGDFLFYEVFGLFRLAAIAQQIYYRYHLGQTRNPAFKGLWMIVNYLNYRCLRRIWGK